MHKKLRNINFYIDQITSILAAFSSSVLWKAFSDTATSDMLSLVGSLGLTNVTIRSNSSSVSKNRED